MGDDISDAAKNLTDFTTQNHCRIVMIKDGDYDDGWTWNAYTADGDLIGTYPRCADAIDATLGLIED